MLYLTGDRTLSHGGRNAGSNDLAVPRDACRAVSQAAVYYSIHCGYSIIQGYHTLLCRARWKASRGLRGYVYHKYECVSVSQAAGCGDGRTCSDVDPTKVERVEEIVDHEL